MTREEILDILKQLVEEEMAKQITSKESRNLLILKSNIVMSPDDRRKVNEEIKRGMENGVIILQPYFEPLLGPNDIDIRIEPESDGDI